MSDRVPLGQTSDVPETPQAPVVENRVEPTSYLDDMEYHWAADVLEVNQDERTDSRLAEKISFLYDWAGETTQSADRLTRMEAVKDLARQLGLQIRGKELISKLYQYARLDQDKKRIEREMKLIK